jgi:hypothetical protein
MHTIPGRYLAASNDDATILNDDDGVAFFFPVLATDAELNILVNDDRTAQFDAV